VRALRRNLTVPFYMHPGLLDKISWVQGDILDVNGLMENMVGCDKIIHAAGLVSFNPSDKKNLFQLNI
jgi:nucleoside-diphosphate-sugar epimerase